MYFGFTFCPEICPAEMIKMGHVYDALTGDNSELTKEAQDRLLPLFVRLSFNLFNRFDLLNLFHLFHLFNLFYLLSIDKHIHNHLHLLI